MKTKITFAAAMIFPFGCATVPENAPSEFKEAAQAIEEMDDADAEDTMPKTAEYAEETFEESLDLLDEAEESSFDDTLVSRATDKAVKARDNARRVTNIHNKLNKWDDNRDVFSDALAKIESSRQDINVTMIEPTSPLAKLADTELVNTVAYFNTNSASDPIMNNNEIESLVNILETSSASTLTLTGYADPRGDEKANKTLAHNRAKEIASLIKDKGIESNRISVESEGESGSMFTDDDSAAKLQLDRRVVARVVLAE
jgi:outer membrane protein OmpA-like peptidoglycan-associated protein